MTLPSRRHGSVLRFCQVRSGSAAGAGRRNSLALILRRVMLEVRYTTAVTTAPLPSPAGAAGTSHEETNHMRINQHFVSRDDLSVPDCTAIYGPSWHAPLPPLMPGMLVKLCLHAESGPVE